MYSWYCLHLKIPFDDIYHHQERKLISKKKWHELENLLIKTKWKRRKMNQKFLRWRFHHPLEKKDDEQSSEKREKAPLTFSLSSPVSYTSFIIFLTRSARIFFMLQRINWRLSNRRRQRQTFLKNEKLDDIM